MKNIYLVLALCLFSFASFAQDESKMDFGFQGGINVSSLGDLPDDYEKDGGRLGFTAGIFARFKTGNTGFYFQPEVNFTQSGGKLTYNNLLFQEIELNTRITTIDVPLLLGIRLGGKKLGIFAHGGPVVSTILNAQSKLKTSDFSSETDIIEQTQRIQVGLQVGAGVGVGPIMVSMRYQYNFTKLYEDNTALDYATGDAKVSLLQFTLGFKLF